MITALISRLIILVFGTLYPAYASYKAVKTKDVKEYVKWMMYWIVFAFFVTIETFTDVLLSFWFPFYYEIKVFTVLWLLSPATKGSSLLYRNFVHPLFLKREKEIDEMLVRAKERGYNTVLSLGTKGVSYATNVILQTAMKGGGGLMEQILRKSYSLTDLSPPVHRATDAPDSRSGVEETRQMVRKRRGMTGSASNLTMTFPEVDVNIMPETVSRDIISDIRSIEDISSGYSSTDQLYSEGVLTRSSSVSSARAVRRGGRVALSRRTPLPEDSDESDDFDTPTLFLPNQQLDDPITPDPAPTTTPLLESSPIHTLTVFEFKKSPSVCSIQSHASDTSAASSSCDPERRGKYKKRTAPKPPGLSASSLIPYVEKSPNQKSPVNVTDEINPSPPQKSVSSFETTIF